MLLLKETPVLASKVQLKKKKNCLKEKDNYEDGGMKISQRDKNLVFTTEIMCW